MAWEISFTWEGKYQVQEVCGQMFKAGIIKTSEKAILSIHLLLVLLKSSAWTVFQLEFRKWDYKLEIFFA